MESTGAQGSNISTCQVSMNQFQKVLYIWIRYNPNKALTKDFIKMHPFNNIYLLDIGGI